MTFYFRILFSTIMSLMVCMSLVTAPSMVLAQSRSSRTAPPPRTVETRYGLTDPLENSTVPEVINKLTRFALGIVGAVFLMYFIYGGFMWMTAGGESERIKKSHQALSQALIGIAVVVLSYSVIGFVIQLTNQLQTRGGS